MPVFGLQPVVLFGTQRQKERILPPIIRGEDKVCFAVTEPNAGLNTTELKTRAERREGGYVVNGEKIWISAAQIASKMLLLARTTPLDAVKRKTEGLSLFYTDLDRSKDRGASQFTRWGGTRWIRTCCSFRICGFPKKTGSARKGRDSS